MSKDFDKVVRFLETFRWSDPSRRDENWKNKFLAGLLQDCGTFCRMNTNGKGADIIGSDFVIEGKNDLLARTTLQRLLGQIANYVSCDNVRQVYIVIYGDAKQTLYRELKRCIADYSQTDVRVKVVGKIVTDDGLYSYRL